MEFTVEVRETKTIDVKFVKLDVAVRYGDEDMPYDFPFRKGDYWKVIVDAETGRILDWPQGVSHKLDMKVVDCGSYYLLDGSLNRLASIEGDYVPHGVVPGRYGDYIELDIDDSGTIRNWPKRMDVSAFFPVD